MAKNRPSNKKSPQRAKGNQPDKSRFVSYPLKGDKRKEAMSYEQFLRGVRRNKIAFIDESYVAHQGNNSEGIYSLAAVILDSSSVCGIRENFFSDKTGLGFRFWHTSDAFTKTPQDIRGDLELPSGRKWPPYLHRDNIPVLLETVKKYASESVVSVLTSVPANITEPIDDVLQKLRKRSLETLVRKLYDDHQITAFVLEKQKQAGSSSKDKKTIDAVEGEYDKSPKFQTYFAAPEYEPVLWAADLVAWSSKRYVHDNDTDWYTNAKIYPTWYDADTGTKLRDMTDPVSPEEAVQILQDFRTVSKEQSEKLKSEGRSVAGEVQVELGSEIGAWENFRLQSLGTWVKEVEP